jgi:4-amino-4-deoxy-L-arabinose transferase-like glycosyltransferase
VTNGAHVGGRSFFARGGLAPRAVVVVAIAAVVLLCDLVYISRPAWVWDETYYFPFSAGVRRWFAHPSLDEATVNAVFREGNAHPPLPIYCMAITGGLLQSDPADFLLAVRLSTALQFAGLAVLVYLFVKREAGVCAAAFATALTVFSPRLFADSLMATYDVPMCLAWLAATVAFYRGMTSRRWAVAAGFIFAGALLTKVNAFLLPVALWPWGFWFYRRRALPAVISMCVAGPLVFFALWPWLWMHPLHNLAEYVVDKFPPGVVPSAILSWTGTAAVGWRETSALRTPRECPGNTRS